MEKVNYRNVWGLLLCVLVLGTVFVRFASAEKANLSPTQLRTIATHVFVGKVVAIRERTEEKDGWRYVYYVAHVKINRVEKGASLRQGAVCDVRYWHRYILPKPHTAAGQRGGHGGTRMVSLGGTAGHRGLPTAGDTLRVYLARNAYDGFTYNNHDGGFNVIGANGFQKLAGGKTPRRNGIKP